MEKYYEIMIFSVQKVCNFNVHIAQQQQKLPSMNRKAFQRMHLKSKERIIVELVKLCV